MIFRCSDSEPAPGLISVCPWVKPSLVNALPTVTEAEIWGRAIRPDVGDMTSAAARELLRLHLAEGDTTRVRELSAKANHGTLADEEAEELDHYLNVGRALEYLKAKARLSLRDQPIAA